MVMFICCLLTQWQLDLVILVASLPSLYTSKVINFSHVVVLRQSNYFDLIM